MLLLWRGPDRNAGRGASEVVLLWNVWPDGHQFRACWQCNNSTSAVDQVVSSLSRIGISNRETLEQRADGEAKLEAFIKHYPHLALAMNNVSPHQARGAIRDGLITHHLGLTLRHHPLLAVPTIRLSLPCQR